MIDSHCHLDHKLLFDDLDNIIHRSKKEGIKKLLTICTNLDSFKKILEIIKKDEIIFGTFGIHPHEVKNDLVKCDAIKQKIINEKKIIGIGETGLDFYYNHSDKDIQIKSFHEHINASIETNLPIIVHSRNAEIETFDILNQYKDCNLKILMHCFTGTKDFAQKLLDLNTYFSASGIITFKKTLELQETFKTIPINKLLIETDSPYLAPIPKRGVNNEPSFIRYTAAKLAELREIDSKHLIDTTSSNFNNLFFN